MFKQHAAGAQIQDAVERTIQVALYRDFKEAGARGILNCKIESLILPLLADHVLREANHYIRILQCVREREST